jgi:probable O-glycosylation ligase (exosortase A-associated)
MLRTIFVMSILVPGFFMALKDRFKALLLYLWFAFFRPQDWMWLDISALKPSLAIGLVLIVPSILTGIMPDLTHPLSVGALAFLGSSFLAQFNAVNADVGWNWIDFMTRLLLVCLLATTLITTARRLVAVIAVMAGSFGIHAAKAGLASMLGGGIRFFDGLSGAFVDNNGYACGTVMIMPFLLAAADNLDYLVPADRPQLRAWGRRAFLIAVPLCGFTVISTFSRGGFIALATSTLVYVALHRRRVRLALSLSALVVLGLLFVPMPDGYADRLDTLNSYEQDEGSAVSRFHFWEVAKAMADAQPLGVGLRNYEYAYDAYDFSNGRFGHGRAVHSSHFQVLAELGYPGAAIWIGQFGLAFIIALRVRRKSWTPGLSPDASRLLASISTSIIVSMAGFLVGGSFLAMALNDVTWLTFAILAALDRVATKLCLDVKNAPVADAQVVTAPFVPVVRRPAALGSTARAGRAS